MEKQTETIEAAEVPAHPIEGGLFVVIRRHQYSIDGGFFYIHQATEGTLTAAAQIIEKRLGVIDGGNPKDYKIFRLPIPKEW